MPVDRAGFPPNPHDLLGTVLGSAFGEQSSQEGETDSHTDLRSTRIFSADQAESFSWPVPSRSPRIPRECVTLKRESLRTLMGGERAEEVFDRYYAAYSACFTNSNEAETKEDLRSLLQRGGGDWDIVIISWGDQIVAGYHTKLASISSYNLGLVSVGEYLWTSQSVRGTGLGKLLYSKTIELRQSQGSQGHFGEIRDIHLLPTEELVRDLRSGTGAKERIGFWKSQERFALDAPWLQPPLSAGKEEIDFYMLTMSRLVDYCPQAFPRDSYLELWTKFYPRHVRTRYFEKLKALTEDTPLIRLIPIDQPRSFIRQAREMW